MVLAGWNGWLLASAALAIGLGLFHSIAGERYLVRRLLRRENLPKLFGNDSFTRLTIRYAWHLLTIAVFGLSALLVWAAQPAPPEGAAFLARLVSITWFVGAAWAVVATRGRHLSWIVLLAAAVLSWLGGT